MNHLLRTVRDYFSPDWPEESFLDYLIQFLIEKEWYPEPRNVASYKSMLLAEGYAVNIENLIQFLTEKKFLA